jgi:hypothetical protein
MSCFSQGGPLWLICQKQVVFRGPICVCAVKGWCRVKYGTLRVVMCSEGVGGPCLEEGRPMVLVCDDNQSTSVEFFFGFVFSRCDYMSKSVKKRSKTKHSIIRSPVARTVQGWRCRSPNISKRVVYCLGDNW